ncbi:MAG TPA: nucleotidyl transferase AbiEii/AbiGii toxin family protein [Saprospiraceae bacterium]|nr:nucleotidyl transferase AbiEii/AbiGii toxin family protein [Saprospiraceae bacterium]
MSAFPSEKTLLKLSSELNTEPAFLEKDWYVCLAVKGLAEYLDPRFEPIFCGGTSLLHGYKLINRFSEDVDFRIITRDNKPASRNERRNYRERLIEAFGNIPEISIVEESLISRDEGNFFGIKLAYPKHFPDHASIRPEIQLEGTFEDQVLPGLVPKVISPIIGKYVDVDCVSTIRCLSLLETAADKISALTWRVIKRQRSEEDPDQTVIRHLYDIHALSLSFGNEFIKVLEIAKIVYLTDRKRRGGNAPGNLHDALAEALKIFREDQVYEREYQSYVRAMCFGQTEPPDFDQVLAVYESLIKNS